MRLVSTVGAIDFVVDQATSEFVDVEIGQVQLTGGEDEVILVKAVSHQKKYYIDLRSVTLDRVEQRYEGYLIYSICVCDRCPL